MVSNVAGGEKKKSRQFLIVMSKISLQGGQEQREEGKQGELPRK
jgi:hypothetical protein